MSELYQKRLISKHELRRVPYMMRHSSSHWPEYSSRHWLDSLVRMQSSKSADVHARTFDTLRRFSLTEVVKERQPKHTGVTIHYFHLYSCTIRVICNFVGAHAAIWYKVLCTRCLLYHLALLTYSNVHMAPNCNHCGR